MKQHLSANRHCFTLSRNENNANRWEYLVGYGLKMILLILVFTGFRVAEARQTLPVLPLWSPEKQEHNKMDWLIQSASYVAGIYQTADRQELVLDNGLVRRKFLIRPDVACVDYVNLINGQQLLRAVEAEARISINGRFYQVGGLYGQKENAYLRLEWLETMKPGDSSFHYVSHEVTPLRPFLNWKSRAWTGNPKQGTGKVLTFLYRSALPELKGIEVRVHYALYDGLPLICKWIDLNNDSGKAIQADQVVNEVLAVVEEESAVEGASGNKPTGRGMKVPQGIYIESNFAFNNAMRYPLSDQSTHWKTDRRYTSQVNYNFDTPCLLEVYPDRNMGVTLENNAKLQSIRTYELLMDSYDRERRGLAIRKMYRNIAPWITSNPIFMHLISNNDEEVRAAIDQCAQTGYEGVILSFGSHCNMEDTSAANISKWKMLAGYAHQKKVLIGSYSLFSSRRISDEDDVIDPKTGKPGGAFFGGHAPCMGSWWGMGYLQKLKTFISETGFDIFENDGPYPGDVCASTTHPGHTGLADSQWKQMELQKSLYHWCNENGVYVNAPDWYFLDGTHKIAIGYREVNFSLPREQQMILNRQNIFDGTWDQTPSMGWGFVPLTKYQGGGPEAVLEPLSEHLKAYEQLMIQYYGAGVQACYRGPRLYDTEETKQMVTRVISWYKKYRKILNADVIHLRRADGRDWDGILHVDPKLKTRGMMLVYNPLKERVIRQLNIPLYYTGLDKTALISVNGGKAKKYTLNRNYEVIYTCTLQPESYCWVQIDAP